MKTINHTPYIPYSPINNLFPTIPNPPIFPYITPPPHYSSNASNGYYTYLSPLMQSITTTKFPNIFNPIFQNFEENIYNTYPGDINDYIDDYLVYIQNVVKKLTLININTGEILFDIPLTQTTLTQTIEELLPELLSLSFAVIQMAGA